MANNTVKAAGLILCLLILSGCGTQSAKRAGQGAAIGGLSGAAGGMVSALIFGGDVAEAAARGAAWGATSGAVSGAIVGSQEDKQVSQKAMADAEKQLKERLGEDGLAGLSALATCKHRVAIGYAETAQESSNEAYALAGLWLEALTYVDQGEEQKAKELVPEIIAADDTITTEADADKSMKDAIQGLLNIRKQYNLPEKCVL